MMVSLLKNEQMEFYQRSRKLIWMLGQDKKGQEGYKNIHLMVICLKNLEAKVLLLWKTRKNLYTEVQMTRWEVNSMAWHAGWTCASSQEWIVDITFNSELSVIKPIPSKDQHEQWSSMETPDFSTFYSWYLLFRQSQFSRYGIGFYPIRVAKTNKSTGWVVIKKEERG